MKLLQHKYWWLFLIGAFIILMFVSMNVSGKLDLTSEKRFSISPATKDLFKNADDKIEVEVLLEGNLSSGFRKLNIATKELLNNFRDVSNGKLSFSFNKPADGVADSVKYYIYDSLTYFGITPFNNKFNREEGDKSDDYFFPYAIVKYKDKQKIVDLIGGNGGANIEEKLNSYEALLEYKFDDAIDKLTRKTTPTVGYLLGNGEPMNYNIYDFQKTIVTNYNFDTLNIKTSKLDPTKHAAIFIVKPSFTFTENDKLKLDQYVMNGGKIVWLIDRLFAEADSLQRSEKNEFIAFDKNLELDDILFKYGVRINSNLVQDLTCANQPVVVGNAGGAPQIENEILFPYYPLLTSNSSNPIAKNLNQVLSIFPSGIDTVQAKGIKKTILLSTDTNSRIISTPNMVSMQNVGDNIDYKLYNKSYIPVAVLLEGKFNSLFANRLTAVGQDSAKSITGFNFLSQCAKETKQIVISDADIVTNIISKKYGPQKMGCLKYREGIVYANGDFTMNCLEYLIGNPAIIETRAKDYTLRLLNKEQVINEKKFWQGLNIALPLALILGFGFIMQFVRRRKYSA